MNTTENNTIQPVELMFGDTPVRMIEQDGEFWWIAKDVCDVLEIANSRDALSGLDNDELTSVVTTSGGQNREMNAVNESGLYNLIFKSRKPAAQSFRRWVTHDVLPTIRRTGSYPNQATCKALPEATFTETEQYVKVSMWAQRTSMQPQAVPAFSQAVAYYCRAMNLRFAVHSHTKERLYPISAMKAVSAARAETQMFLNYDA